MGLKSLFKREKKAAESHIEINHGDCGLCEKCIVACPNHVLINDNDLISVRDPQVCKRCRVCMAICKNNCIKVN